MDLFGPDTVYEYYAATEVGGTYITPEEGRQTPGSVGRPFPGATVKIFDEDGNECAPGHIGTIYMRLDFMADFEYYKDAGKTPPGGARPGTGSPPAGRGGAPGREGRGPPARRRLGGYKSPRSVDFVDELP